MKSTPGFQELREASWRRKLTDSELAQLQAFLAAHPEAEAEWQADATLNEALARLPASPVPSNFTARVLGAVERVEQAGRRPRRGWALFQWRLRWLPRAAAAILVIGGALLIYQHDLTAKRIARAEDLVRLSELPALATPDVLENFDAIQKLSQTASADEDLIRLLQ